MGQMQDPQPRPTKVWENSEGANLGSTEIFSLSGKVPPKTTFNPALQRTVKSCDSRNAPGKQPLKNREGRVCV